MTGFTPDDRVLASPPEQLLALGAGFTRYNHALTRLRLNGSGPATAVSNHIAFTQHLARSALNTIDTLNAQRMYHSPGIRAAYARIRQLAHLATDAADHLIDAEDILDDARIGLPGPDGQTLTYREALGEAGRRLTLVRDLTALGADDSLATAELLVTELRRQHITPEHQPPALSPAQHAVLRAVAQGYVTIDRLGDKPYVSGEDIRVSISTIRSLEARGLAAREECPRILHDERVHLTADGCRALAATFGHPRAPALAATRPARPAPAAASGRVR